MSDPESPVAAPVSVPPEVSAAKTSTGFAVFTPPPVSEPSVPASVTSEPAAPPAPLPAAAWPPQGAAWPPPEYAPASQPKHAVTAAPIPAPVALAAYPAPQQITAYPAPYQQPQQPQYAPPPQYQPQQQQQQHPFAQQHAPQVVQVVVQNQLPPAPYGYPHAHPYYAQPQANPYAMQPYAMQPYAMQPYVHPALYAGPYAQPVGNAIVQNLPAGTLVRVGQRDRLTYALLALFLGFVGGHKFYTGRIGEGLFYLFFSWTGLPALVSFVEGVAALAQSDEDFDVRHNVRAVG